MEVVTPNFSDNITSMQNMVDMALGTPEVGAVNFTVLHTLLHAMLKKMNIQQVKVESPPEDPDECAPDSGQTIKVNQMPYHQLQDRIKILESQVSDLNSLPKNNDIMAGFISSKPDDAKRTVSDLWQVLNLRKRVGGNEEGIDRLSALMDSMLNEMRQLKEENNKLKQKLDELSGLGGLGDKVNSLENDLTNLQAELNKLKDRLNEYPNPESFKNVVTWEGLEQALRGVKEDMDKLKPSDKVFVNIATEPMSRPGSGQSSSFGPSEACAEMLEKIGNLSDAHDALEKRVEILEKEMPNKADKKDLENLKMPDDLMKTINLLKSQIDQLMNSKNRDNEALARIRDMLNGLQDKMKELNDIVAKVESENKDLSKQIQELFGITSDHETRKADISYVDGQLRTKADKSLVDSKVSFSLFDETTGNLNNLIDDVLKKLMNAEEELRNLLESLAKDLNNKVDKEELNSLREWIEKRLRSLTERLKNMRGLDITDDEAAGLRKQLLQHFHCISCDRPVDMMPQGVNYAERLPDPKGLPPSKSIRPYTTFELDAIRQHAKNNKNIYIQNHTKRMNIARVCNPRYLSYGSEIIDVYQTPRPCGGSHTTTYSHKKMMRMGNMNNSYIEEENTGPPRLTKEELDIQGSDGHIYRGRLNRNHTTMGNYIPAGANEDANVQNRLPPVPLPQTKSGNSSDRGGFVTRPKSAVKISPRPTSSGQNNSRPSSARNFKIQESDSRPSTPNRVDGSSYQLQSTPVVTVVEETVTEMADHFTESTVETINIVTSTNNNNIGTDNFEDESVEGGVIDLTINQNPNNESPVELIENNIESETNPVVPTND